MRRKKLQHKNIILYMTLAASLSVAAPSLAFADTSKNAYGPAWEIEHGKIELPQTGEASQNRVYNGDVNMLKTAAETNQLLVAVGNTEDPAKTTFSYYKKDESGVLKQVFSVEAVSGMNGITEEKKEGDKKTPAGVYSFTMAFGMLENPGSILPYHKVKDGDHFVDDSNSSYYNRLVNEKEVAKDWNSSEVLIRQSPHYNYSLVLNYNPEYTPGKGSAIFLHCPKTANNTGTSGCISIPEAYMKELVKTVDQNTKIIIVQEEKDLAKY